MQEVGLQSFQFLFSGCSVNRQRAGRVRAKWRLPLVAAPCRLSDSAFCLEHGPGKSSPAHTCRNSGLAVAGTRPDSETAASRAAAGRGRGGPTVEWPLIAARVRATSVPACCVAPDHRPSLGVSQSRPMASAFAHGPWLDGCRIQ